MQVELPPEAVAAAEAMVANGVCATVEEAVRLAFLSLAEDERRMDKVLAALEANPEWNAQFHHAIGEGIEDLDAGRTSAIDVAFIDGVKRRGRDRLAQGRSVPA